MATTTSGPPPPSTNNDDINDNNDTDKRDEGNMLTMVSNRFLRMVETPPSEIKNKVQKWTSVETPSEGHVKVALSAVDVPSCLFRGINVLKVSSYGKLKRRVVTISKDKFALFVTHEHISGNALSSAAKSLPLPLFSRKYGFRGFQGKQLREQYVRYIDIADWQVIQQGVVDTSTLESSRSNKTPRLRGYDSIVDQRRSEIVTIFHHGRQTLDLLVENKDDRWALVSTLTQLRDTYRRAMEQVVPEARLLRYVWYDLDRNHDGHLDEREFAKLLNRINLYDKNPSHVYRTFQKSHNIRGDLTYRQCMDLLTEYRQGKVKIGNNTTTSAGGSDEGGTTTATPALQMEMGVVTFHQLFGADQDYVSARTFLETFLQQHQHEDDVSIDDVLGVFDTLNTMELCRDESTLPIKNGYLSKYRFTCYLHHSINDAYNPEALHVSPDTLDKPMSQYWINTSHNTYLTGDQLQSTSSVEMYARALQRGCKCLELDCWDGEVREDDGKTPIPVVFHGHTLTTKILFGDIINVVQAYVQAHPDTFPIILSLENHCSKPYQQVMATVLKETLGDSLYIPTKSDTESSDLPSPQSLKGKVVIKGKRPPEPDDAPVGTISKAGEAASSDIVDDDDPYVTTANNNNKSTTTAPPSSSKILPELAALTLFHGTKYKSFETSINSPPSHMHSIGETKITKIVSQSSENAGLWRMYNLHHMTRTYPAGSRVDSSNYNPVLAWAMGCQMVALNFQTSDTPLMLNDGRFRQNGNVGYVLKPDAILGLAEKKSPSSKKTLKVRVLSGTCLPKPDGDTLGETIDPYVMVTVHDVVLTADGIPEYKAMSHSTSVINDNGFHPVWNETEFTSLPVEFPEVAMVQFNLMESDVTLDDKVADASIPFTCLRRGYRSIQLYDRNSTRTGPFSMATLLVEVGY